MTVVGLALLIYRRGVTPSVFRATTSMNKTMYALLGAVILIGTYNTIIVNLLGTGHDYRGDVSVWFRNVFWFQPDVSLMSSARLAHPAAVGRRSTRSDCMVLLTR